MTRSTASKEDGVSTMTEEKGQLNVRVPLRVLRALDDQVKRARALGKPVTKAKLVADALDKALPRDPEHGWLPVHHGTWNVPLDATMTNAGLLDWLDEMEAMDDKEADQ